MKHSLSAWLTLGQFIATVAFGLIAAPSLAAPTLNLSGGILVGASGVEVSGALYNVEFVEGSCVTLFSGCDSDSDFQFTSYSDGLAASQALLDTVFVGNFDLFPSLIFGCGYQITCFARTPTNLNPFNNAYVEGAVAINNWGAVADSTSGLELSINDDSGTNDVNQSQVWARWTLINTVPEPGTLALLGLGLPAFVGVRRRKH